MLLCDDEDVIKDGEEKTSEVDRTLHFIPDAFSMSPTEVLFHSRGTARSTSYTPPFQHIEAHRPSK
jgi:hypothetical protein